MSQTSARDVEDAAASVVWKPFVKLQNQHFDSITRIKFSPDGTLIATAAADGIVRVFDVRTQQRVGVSSHHFLGINDLCWDCRGKHIYTASSDGVAACLSVDLLEATLPRGPKMDISQTPPGPVIAQQIRQQRGVVGAVSHASATSTEKQGLLPATQSELEGRVRSTSARKKCAVGPHTPSSGVSSGGSRRSGEASSTASAALKGSSSSRTHGRRAGEPGSVWLSGLSGGTGVVGSVPRDLADCDPTGNTSRTSFFGRFPSPEDSSFDFLFGSAMAVASPQCQGDYFLTGGFDEFIRKWDVRQFATVGELRAHSGAVTSLELSHDDRLLASGGIDGCLRLWTSQDFSCWRTFQTCDEPDIPLAHCLFSPNDEVVLTVPICGPPRVFSLSQYLPNSTRLFSYDLPMPPMDCCPIALENIARTEFTNNDGTTTAVGELSHGPSATLENRIQATGVPIDFAADSPALADCFQFWSSRHSATEEADADFSATQAKPDSYRPPCQSPRRDNTSAPSICRLHGGCATQINGGAINRPPLCNETPAEILSSPGGFVRAAFWGRLVLVPQILRNSAVAPHAHDHSPWVSHGTPRMGQSTGHICDLPALAGGCLQAEILSWDLSSGNFATAIISSPFHSHCQVTAIDALQPLRPAFDALRDCGRSGPQVSGGLLASASDHPDCSLIFWVPYVRD